jgi:hypothetical protein
MAMTQSEVKTARMILYVEAIVSLVYGLLFILIPRWMFALSQDPGAPAAAGWVRWSGGLLIGVAIAAGLAAANPQTQKPLVVGLVVAATLIALSLLYSLFNEFGGAQWFLWVPILINAALAVGLVWVSTKQT